MSILGERNNLSKPVSDITCFRAFKMRNHRKQPWFRIGGDGGQTDTTSEPCTCTNKMTLDYVNYSVTFPNVFFILRLCPHLSGGHPRTLLGLVFLKLARVADRTKSQISFFSVNLVFFVTVCCRLVWTANSKLLFSHFSSFVGQIFLEKPLRVPLLVKV